MKRGLIMGITRFQTKLMINSPLSVPVGKGKFIINLNNYRNAHYQILNKAKKSYKLIINNQIKKLKIKKIW